MRALPPAVVLLSVFIVGAEGVRERAETKDEKGKNVPASTINSTDTVTSEMVIATKLDTPELCDACGEDMRVDDNDGSGLEPALKPYHARLVPGTKYRWMGAEQEPKDPPQEGVIQSPQGWQTLHFEGFEGAWPGPWDTFDANPLNGADYWGDVSCKPGGARTGSWTGWCADEGDSPVCGSRYDDNMAAWMIYGPFSLAGYTDAEVLFYFVNNSELGYDTFAWLASINDEDYYGTGHEGTTPGYPNQWQFRNFDLTDVPTLGDLTGQPQVWVAFYFGSDGSVNSYGGAYLDDITIRRYETAPDLVALDVYFRDQPGNQGNVVATPQAGQCVYPHVSYRLDGASVSGKIWKIELDGQQLCAFTSSSHSSGIHVGWCTSCWTATCGPHTLRGVLDPDGTIAEASESNNTASHSFNTTGPPPSAPTGVSASDGTYCDKVRVTWNSMAGASSYKVYRSTSNSPCPGSPIATTTGTSYDDTSATPGTIYYYSVKASNACGDSTCSATNSGYRRAVPSAPTGVSASDGTYCDKVRVTWNSMSGATSYKLYRSTSNSPCPGSPIATTTGTSYDDTSATPGTTYYYSVKASNACGDSTCSATNSGYRRAVPSAPTGVSASDGTYNDRVCVMWNTVSGATVYKLYRSTSNSPCSGSLITAISGTAYCDTSPTPGITYYYSVKASNTCGDGACSNVDSGYAEPEVCLPPTDCQASPSTICEGDSSTLSATPGSGGDTVEWFTGSCGGALVDEGTSITVTPGTTTAYYARTKDTSTGCVSDTCCQVTVTVQPQPCDDCSATRSFSPNSYCPGQVTTVCIDATPGPGASAYAVEDCPPIGWPVDETSITGGGVYDPINHLVKWGPFFDNLPRTLCYDVLPPVDATGCVIWPCGTISCDGEDTSVGGDDEVCESCCPHHPAELDCDGTYCLRIGEVTAYGAAWKRGECPTPGPCVTCDPCPIPINYVTRAGYLWRNGECYHCDLACDPSACPYEPLCWLPGVQPLAPDMVLDKAGPFAGPLAPATELVASAGQRSIRVISRGPNRGSYVVRIAVTPLEGSEAWAVEDMPPLGWTVSRISHKGEFDEAAGTIRWGPFLDDKARTLRYVTTPPEEGKVRADRFAGVTSIDGVSGDIAGDAAPPSKRGSGDRSPER